MTDLDLLALRVISDDDCHVHEVAPYVFIPNGWPREVYYDRLDRLKRDSGFDDDQLDRPSAVRKKMMHTGVVRQKRAPHMP